MTSCIEAELLHGVASEIVIVVDEPNDSCRSVKGWLCPHGAVRLGTTAHPVRVMAAVLLLESDLFAAIVFASCGVDWLVRLE